MVAKSGSQHRIGCLYQPNWSTAELGTNHEEQHGRKQENRLKTT